MVLLALHFRHVMPTTIHCNSECHSIHFLVEDLPPGAWCVVFHCLSKIPLLHTRHWHHFGVHGTNQATFLLHQNNHQNDASDLSKCFVKVCEMQLVQTLSETMICQKEQENNESINIFMETWFCLAKGWIQPLFLHFSLEKIWMHHSRSVPELLGAF